MSSIENIVDEAANVAVLDAKGRVKNSKIGRDNVEEAASPSHFEPLDQEWKRLWNEGTPAVMDVPVGGVCEILYGN